MNATTLSAAVEAKHLLTLLSAQADPAFALRTQRYFPTQIQALGVGNQAVGVLAKEYLDERRHLTTEQRLEIAQEVLVAAEYHEEVLLAFALLHKVARRGLGADFLDLARGWLEQDVTNWAQCDDLCLKLLYPYFQGHLDRIALTQAWVHSPSPWARRAANVAVVKFVRRQVGRTLYELPLEHVFGNCTTLMDDPEYYVQKGSGWLLKVTGQVHPERVGEFVAAWRHRMRRDTFRYAIESLEPGTRARLMALDHGGTV